MVLNSFKPRFRGNGSSQSTQLEGGALIEDVQSHRLKSREHYPAKRQVQQLELLKKQIEIDQEMWSTERLRRRETRNQDSGNEQKPTA